MRLELGPRPGEGTAARIGVRAAARASCIAAFVAALALAPWTLGACSGGGSGSSAPGVFQPGHGVVPEPPPATIAELCDVGDVVGVLELEAPSVTPFTLRGTLPVPARTLVESDGTMPFQVRSADGVTVDAQVLTVTRWPRAQDGADVVEILARVDRPAGVAPGARVRYEIVYQPHAAGAVTPGADVVNLLATPEALLLRTRDVFGHEYTADLYADARSNDGSARTLARGRYAARTATHEVLKPVAPAAGPTGTLPHLMGVHAYVTRWTDEDFLSLDLRVHAAFSGRDATTTDDDPLGAVYFDGLELVLPSGWTAFEAVDNPWAGACVDDGLHAVKPLVRPIETGALHLLPRMGQFERRLVIARAGAEARALASLRREGLGFCREGTNAAGAPYFSWWNPATGRWYAQRHTLPSLGADNEAALHAALAGQAAALEQQVRTGSSGTWPTEELNLGWAHPWGIQAGGMVSGAEIYLYDGADVAQAASREGVLLTELRHRMSTDRQPNVLFNADGRAARASEWVVHSPGGEYLPVWWYVAPMLWASDPFGYSAAPTFQADAVAAQGRKPWYEAELLGYEPVDWQHLVRYTRNAKTLVWLENDTLAREDLRAQAEGFLFGYSDLPQDLYGNIIPTGLLAMRNYVAVYPGRGVAYGRGESWGLDAVLCAYSTADDAWRAALLPWCRSLVDMLERGQATCTGVIQATPQYNVFDGQYRCRQSIEAAIMENALVGLRESVLENADVPTTARLNEVLRRAFYAMVSPYVWSNTYRGPWAMMAVGPFDMAQPLFCSGIPADGNYGFADHYQPWSSLAYAWELTRDPLFLQKAEQMLGGPDLVATLTADPLENWQNRAALIQVAQTLPPDQAP